MIDFIVADFTGTPSLPMMLELLSIAHTPCGSASAKETTTESFFGDAIGLAAGELSLREKID